MYNFIDVTEASEGYVLPSEALKINGEYIEDLISGYRTLNVKGREALSPDVVSYSTGIRDGSKLKSKRFPERTITVTYQLVAESNEAFREAYNQLGRILNVENAQLIFNDEQDKFFTGTPCVIGEVKPGTNSVVGEFEILCTDPFKYSVYEYEAVPDMDESSVLIDYNGTYKAYPTLEANFYNEEEASADGETVTALTGSGDCGYVAFFNDDEKIIQLGDPDEVDGENAYAKSQTLVNSTFKTSSAWGTAAKNQWAVNSGTTSSSAVVQTGTPNIGVASYAVPATPQTTSRTVLEIWSKAENPYVYYKVKAKGHGRTANSVKVTFSISASMENSNSFWYNGTLIVAVYIGGSWHNVTMKTGAESWWGTTTHTKNITATVTGLAKNTASITGIKFKAYRSDSFGNTGVINETACKDLHISEYVDDIPETYYLTASNYGTGSDWHGPSITRTIPADASGEVGAKNFTFSFCHKMSIGEGNSGLSQLGAFQVMLVSRNGSNKQIVAGVNVYKGGSGKTANLRFYAFNNVMKTLSVDLSHNNTLFNSSKTATIKKSSKDITFDIGGHKYVLGYVSDTLANVAVNEITITFTSFGTKPALSYNGLYWAKFVKNNCDTWKDIPNKFSANDVVKANCKNGEVFLNGVPSPELGALGNDWEEFCLNPGLNQIGVSYSNWVQDEYAPSFKVRYREVFL